MKKAQKALSIFGFFGSIMLAGAGFWTWHISNFIDGAERTEGEVIRMLRSSEGNARPVVQFTTLAGKKVIFESSLSSSPPLYHEGEQVGVFYQLEQPSEAMIDGFMSLWFGPLVVGGIGVVFVGMGFGHRLWRRYRKQRAADLKSQGLRIEADYQSVQPANIKIANQRGYVVRGQWLNPANGKVHVFDSDPVFYDPEDFIDRDKLTVYIQRGDPSTYHVDISFLPQLA